MANNENEDFEEELCEELDGIRDEQSKIIENIVNSDDSDHAPKIYRLLFDPKTADDKIIDESFSPELTQQALINVNTRLHEYFRELDEQYKEASGWYEEFISSLDYIRSLLQNFYTVIGVDFIDIQDGLWREFEKPKEKRFIYFIQNQYNHQIKIGTSNNVDRRLSSLQTACGDILEVIGAIYFNDKEIANKCERGLHQHFSYFRKNPNRRQTEWFDGCIKGEILEILKLQDPAGYVERLTDYEAKELEETQKKFCERFEKRRRQHE